MKFTRGQRAALENRVAKAIIWYQSTSLARDNARAMARSLISQIEEDNTQRNSLARAVTAIEQTLEEAS